MRLLALDCTQVGHWDALPKLTLSPRVTVVLGDNEAGKSTLRRALRALLFGPDKALVAPLSVGGFEMSAHLQVGMTEACTLHRKGRNLQAPLSAGAESLLSAANAGRFSSLFDLTHENLSPQDQAFLKADGALGSLMFGARTGVSPARLQQARQHVEQSLAAADSRRQGLMGIPYCQEQLQEARRRHDALARFGENDALHAQHQGWIAKVEQLDARLDQLDKKAGWLQGLIDGAAEVQQLAQARQARDVLVAQGTPPTVAQVAEYAQRLLHVEAQAQALLDRRAELQDAQAELDAAEAPGELHALTTQCDALRDVVAAHTADGGVQEDARQRLGKKRAELEQVLARMGAAGGDDPVATARALLRPEPMAVQLRALVSRHDELHRTLQQKNELLSAAQQRLQGIEVEDADPAATAVDALDAALPYLQSASAAEQEIARLDAARAEALPRLRDQQAALCLASDVGNPDALQPPTAEAAGQAEQALAAASQQLEVARKQWQGRNGDLYRLQQQLAERRVQIGSVASPEDVVQVRTLRDARLEALCAALSATEGTLSAPTLVAQAGELRTLVRQSDLLVDRRMEAGEALGQLRAGEQQAEELARECEKHHQELAAAEVAVADAKRCVSALWPFLLHPPASSAVWLAEYQAWRRAAQVVQQYEQEIGRQRDALAVARTDGLALLAGSLPQLQALASAQAMLDVVVRERDARRLRTGRIEALHKQRNDAGIAVTAAQEAVTSVNRALTDWQAQWDTATRDLPDGLARVPDVIASWLALQEALRTALGELDALTGDIETRAVSLAEKRQHIDQLVQAAQALAPDFQIPPGLEPAAAFALVDDACKVSASRLAYRRSLERDHAQALRDVEAARAAHAGSHAALLDDLAAAGIADACNRESLAAIAARAKELDALDRQIASAEASLTGRWGHQMPAAIDQLASSSVTVLSAELNDIKAELEQAKREREAAADARRDARQALEAMQQGHDAAGVAHALADAREALFDKVEERFRLQVAKLILERAQREASDGGQGLQDVASGYFRMLTGGVYSGLRISDEDAGAPELVAVDSGRREKSLVDLSAGTRDQIWLALRLAGVVAAARETPFPLLLDDSLVQFDETRAKAALQLLHQISEHVQVILFTHHDHMADLADAVVPADDLAVVVLPAVTGAMRARTRTAAPAVRRERPGLAAAVADTENGVAEDGGARRGVRDRDEAKALILRILRESGAMLGRAEILQRAADGGTDLQPDWGPAKDALLAERHIVQHGERKGARYALRDD